MSKGHNKNSTFVDTGLLRDHISKLDVQKRLASDLYECIETMKKLCDPTVAYQYDSILRDAERLLQYFTKMVVTLDHIEYEANRMSIAIRTAIDDDAEATHRKTSENLML